MRLVPLVAAILFLSACSGAVVEDSGNTFVGATTMQRDRSADVTFTTPAGYEARPEMQSRLGGNAFFQDTTDAERIYTALFRWGNHYTRQDFAEFVANDIANTQRRIIGVQVSRCVRLRIW